MSWMNQGSSRSGLRMIEKGIGSKGRLRILQCLTADPRQSLSRYMLERKTGIRSNFLDADLRALMELGWVIEHQGQIRRYSLNPNSDVAGRVVHFLESVSADAQGGGAPNPNTHFSRRHP
jgi:DNA-binding HxlR family transcriptional regulator